MNSKSVLITGCSSGIGQHVALALQARGYRVFASARKAADVAALAAQGLESLQLDLDDSTSIQAAVREVLARTDGQLFALVNNAGYGQAGAVEDLRRAVIRAQFETNLFGPLELTNLIVPVMRAQGYGRIINISSLLGLAVLPYRGAYNASKFALEGLTDTLRLELRDTGILVSLIEPGPIISRFRSNSFITYQQNIDPERSAHRKNYLAMERRLTQPGPVAPFTLTPQAVQDKLVHALEHPRPKLRYYVTFPTHLAAALRRILPYRALDWVLYRISGGGKA
ncbi:MAG TPA: SDR family NAD(P)-dependent oxidoreductase [Gammaproteobacteria bacterium]|nr:SDR family NAD(P)-dependent oxidoreductase [Gammaproteobacteria bacterium]